MDETIHCESVALRDPSCPSALLSVQLVQFWVTPSIWVPSALAAPDHHDVGISPSASPALLSEVIMVPSNKSAQLLAIIVPFGD